MNTFTHLGISLAIKKAVEKELEIKLDTMSFMFGNIKPDISSSLINIPHFKKDSMDFVTLEIKKLMQNRIKKYSKCTKEFSEKLGIITHYLSDFFCYAHSQKFQGNIIDHYIYEARLSAFCKRNSVSIKMFNYSKYLDINNDYRSICDLIDRLHNKYSLKEPSYAVDITFALRMCISLAISVISACIIKEEVELAA